jgi:hypothetical protein
MENNDNRFYRMTYNNLNFNRPPYKNFYNNKFNNKFNINKNQSLTNIQKHEKYINFNSIENEHEDTKSLISQNTNTPFNFYPSEENKVEFKDIIEKLSDIDISVKRGSYILAIISVENFVKKGAKKLDSGIFWIKKEYNGTPMNETSALIGIKVKDIFNLLLDENEFLNRIRNDDELKYISLIDKLTCKFIQHTISKFRSYLLDPSIREDLALFNIEPKGDGKLERSYPIPRISIPGGKMEDIDLFDFEKCAFREFHEETGLDITYCHKKLSREKIKRGFRFSHFTNLEDDYKFLVKNNKKNETKYVSMYYLVKID